MNKPIVNITTSAFKKMNTIMKQSNNTNGFIFGVSSGGCSGFNFDLRLIHDKELHGLQKNKPNIISNKNINVYIDPISEIYLIGTTLDYQEENFSKGIFESKFLYNVDKQVATSCGCGVSFSPRNI
jgi:iron-sulfur cluster assembly protein